MVMILGEKKPQTNVIVTMERLRPSRLQILGAVKLHFAEKGFSTPWQTGLGKGHRSQPKNLTALVKLQMVYDPLQLVLNYCKIRANRLPPAAGFPRTIQSLWR